MREDTYQAIENIHDRQVYQQARSLMDALETRKQFNPATFPKTMRKLLVELNRYMEKQEKTK